MKVKELKELLNEMNNDNEVIIDIYHAGFINPRANIKMVQAGFDWFDGYVIITPDMRLMPAPLPAPPSDRSK
jgi:hypothetical protein